MIKSAETVRSASFGALDQLVRCARPTARNAAAALAGDVEVLGLNLADTLTNEFAMKANKLDGFTPTTTPAGANG
jgi:NitT/TauT family transport system substrate-binding protein